MRIATIAFLAGIVFFQQLSSLPDGRWAGLLFISLPLSICFVPLKVPLWLINGFLVALLQTSNILGSSLALELSGKDVVIEGVVSSIPQQRQYGQRFEFTIEASLSPGVLISDLPDKVRLNWYRSQVELAVGQRWQLRVRLKQPHGFMNPGGFDYEAWLFRHGIRATGYVRKSDDNRYLADADGLAYWLDQQRSSLALQIENGLVQGQFKGMIQALAIGLRDDISQQQWDVLLKTGTNHLMAISGLHVGLVAGLVFFVMRWLWGRSGRLLLYLPAAKAGAVAAIAAALIYAALAGFSVPTQRALIMVVVFMLALISQRYRRPGDGLLLALLLVLFIDPLAVMDAGFWLSFAAVAFILLGMGGRLKQQGLWWKWGRVHALIALALMPLTLLLFQKASMVSPLANFVAVPIVSLLVVPLVLLAVLLLPITSLLSNALLQLADYCLQLLWPLLTWLAALPSAQVEQGLTEAWLIIPLGIGVIWLLAPRGWPGRWLGGMWIGIAFLLPVPKPEYGEAHFSLLDVGQGLAAVVRTRNRILVFDSGPKFSDSFDTGKAVVLPFLLNNGIAEIDMLIVSHGDNDHIGGVDSLMKRMPVKRLLTSSMEKLAAYDAQPCQKGQRWQWDGVAFEILHPESDAGADENNGSCVLKVSSQAGSVLMTGDIERRAERVLLANNKAGLAADVLVVPHHGSKTSSSPDFVQAVSPRWALFPVGHANRFRLPRTDVVKRYLDNGANVLLTGQQGAVEILLGNREVSNPKSYRYENSRYWTHFPKQALVLTEK